MRIAFYVQPLSLRGTATTVWMYAWIAKHMLGHESVILGGATPEPREDGHLPCIIKTDSSYQTHHA